MNIHTASRDTTNGKKETIWTPLFVQLIVINAISNFGHFMMSTLVPRYAEHLGATPSYVGVVASAFAITALAVRPIVGPATTTFRKNRLFAAANGIIFASIVCYALADSVAVLLVGRLLQGIGMGFLVPVSMAMVADALPDSKMASGVGIFSLGQALAMAVGPYLGLVIVKHFDYSGVFVFGSVLIALTVVLAFRLKTGEPERNGRFQLSWHNFFAKEVLVPTVMMFFLSGAQACIQAFILIYGGANDVEQIGLFFTAYAVFVLFSRPVSGRVADKYGMDKMIIPGILTFALSFVIISFARTLPMFVLAGAISAFGYGICQPLVQTLCMKMVSPERRGVASNTNYIGVDIGFFLMPIFAGLIVSFAQEAGVENIESYAIMFRVMTIPILVALLIFLVNRGKMREYL